MISSNERLVYSPIIDRPRVTWPGGKTVAVWHAPNVEHYDFVAPGGGGPTGRALSPDPQHYFHREFGNRVGFWRMLRAIDEYEIPSTASLSLVILEEFPEIRDAMAQRNWEIMSHGISNLRPLFGLDAEQESEFYRLNQALAQKYWGKPIKGMLGPRVSGTDATCDLMAEHGMIYHADWIHDEQPRPLRTSGDRKLVSIPYSFMLNDFPIVTTRNHTGRFFADQAKAQVSRLLRDAEEDGQARVTCVATHPFVSGQPHMIRYIEEIFDYLRSDPRIWIATAEEISEYYIEHFYDEQVAHAAARAGEVPA
ncbi:polysaccharide deacetylase family protein [Rhodococcus sp. CH91]|uniref:polysaccharide deacetylase family protein n=1 Tax=Rhodococcus sp. CH91 TaxID=2910256 RepID=UPI001F4B27B9|nr:polysaccharide deacetylase family protein [Rhodococcus sp. CH91]